MARRLGPDDVAEVTAARVRRVVTDLIDTDQREPGDPDVLVVPDAGYDAPRLAHLLAALPIEVPGRMRSDRVTRRPAPSRTRGACRPTRHGAVSCFADPGTWGAPDAETMQVTDRYGTAWAVAFDRLHPHPTTRCAWIDHTGELPIIEGAQIRLTVDRLPSGQGLQPVWLWSSKTGMTGEDVDLRWQEFLRRFGIEHTFRVIKRTLR